MWNVLRHLNGLRPAGYWSKRVLFELQNTGYKGSKTLINMINMIYAVCVLIATNDFFTMELSFYPYIFATWLCKPSSYFKLRLFNPTECIVRNIKGVQHRVAKIQKISLWKKLYFLVYFYAERNRIVLRLRTSQNINQQ